MSNQTKRITIEVSESTHQDLEMVVKNCNLSNNENEGFTSHGELTVAGLLAMLAEDAAMANSRPGSWEGAGMQTVLDSHGYH